MPKGTVKKNWPAVAKGTVNKNWTAQKERLAKKTGATARRDLLATGTVNKNWKAAKERLTKKLEAGRAKRPRAPVFSRSPIVHIDGSISGPVLTRIPKKRKVLQGFDAGIVTQDCHPAARPAAGRGQSNLGFDKKKCLELRLNQNNYT